MSYFIGSTLLGMLGGWWYGGRVRAPLPLGPIRDEEDDPGAASQQLVLLSKIRTMLVGAAAGAALGGKLWVVLTPG